MLQSSRLSLAPSPYRPLSYFKSEMAGRIKNLKLGLINIINYILYILANKFQFVRANGGIVGCVCNYVQKMRLHYWQEHGDEKDKNKLTSVRGHCVSLLRQVKPRLEIKHIFLALSFAMVYGMCSVGTSGTTFIQLKGN